MNLTIWNILSVGTLVAIIQLIGVTWLKSWVTAHVKHEWDRKLEDYRSETRRREQAAQVAQLLALNYRPGTAAHEFNALAWELTLWLPADLVRELTRCLCQTEGAMSPKEVLIAIRKHLLGRDDLTPDQIVHREDPSGRGELAQSLMTKPETKSLSD